MGIEELYKSTEEKLKKGNACLEKESLHHREKSTLPIP